MVDQGPIVRNRPARPAAAAPSSLARHLLLQIARTPIVLEQLRIPLASHLHELVRLALARRALLLLLALHARLGRRMTVLLRLVVLRRLRPVQGFALGVLLVDGDGDLMILELDDLADFDVVDGAQEGAFALDFPFGEIKGIHCARQAVGAVGGIEDASTGDPGVVEAVVDGDAFVNVDGEHAIDQIQCWVTNRVPVRGRVVEATHFDLLGEVVGVFGGVEFVGEGGETAEADVEDNTQGPDVHGAGVFAVTGVFEDFGCDVWE